MPQNPSNGIGQELANVPFGELLGSVGVAIAEAQYRMDLVGMRLAQMMAGSFDEIVYDANGENPETRTRDTRVKFGPEPTAAQASAGATNQFSLLELGFTPSFYQFVDTVVEVKVSITITTERSSEVKRNSSSFDAKLNTFLVANSASIRTSSVSAQFASKYDYRAEASSMVRTKIVPLPPPAILEERIRQYIQQNNPIDPS